MNDFYTVQIALAQQCLMAFHMYNACFIGLRTCVLLCVYTMYFADSTRCQFAVALCDGFSTLVVEFV